MSVILEIFRFLKTLVFLSSAFFFIACNNKPTQVDPGDAQAKKVFSSRSCAGGSFTITKSVVGTSSAELQMGDKVTVQGTINNANPCRQGSVSFTCEAIYSIANNRSFVCEKGTVSSPLSVGVSPTTVTSGTSPIGTTTPTTGVLSPSSNALVSGEVHIFGNGTQSFVRIALPSSSALVPQATCLVSFRCL